MTAVESVVVDCSVVVDALTLASASHLRDRLTQHALIAPVLLDYEVLNAIRGLNLGGHLSGSRAVEALTDFADLAIDKVGLTPTHYLRIWALRTRVTAYDAAYLALAHDLGATLLTRDRKLADNAAGVTIEVL